MKTMALVDSYIQSGNFTFSGSRYNDIGLYPTPTARVYDLFVGKKHDYVVKIARAIEAWRSETMFSSSLDDILSHRCYNEIVSLGDVAVSEIIARLRAEPSLLVFALEDITGQVPYSDDDAGDIQAMTECWIAWCDKR